LRKFFSHSTESAGISLAQERSEPPLWQFLVSTTVVVVILVYGMITINTGDPRWFQKDFSEQPASITVFCRGVPVEVPPASQEFQEITALFNAAISGPKRWDSLSLSDATYDDYHTHPRMVVLELRYAAPVRIHSNVKYFSNVEYLIMPLAGRHANTNAVFGRNQGYPIAGSFHVKSRQPLVEYVRTHGLCDVSMDE
jgi:hypothetical protein